jgi:AcrR family transcriptional regulator
MTGTLATKASDDSSSGETRQRILRTAEQLFAERGIAAVSIRDITRAANVNLGAINYHFGTKRSLAAEVFKNCFEPVKVRQMTLLDHMENEAGGLPLTLEAVLEALIRPVVERGFAEGTEGDTFLRLMGGCFSERDIEIRQLVRAHFDKLIRRFDEAFLRAVPGLNPEELFWCINFNHGALHLSLLACAKQSGLLSEFHRHIDASGLVKRLITFMAAGFRTAVAQ